MAVCSEHFCGENVVWNNHSTSITAEPDEPGSLQITNVIITQRLT